MTGFSQVPKYIALMILDRRELEASWGNIALSCKWARRHINILRIKKLSERGIDIYPASHYYLGDKKLKSTLPEPLLPRLFQDLSKFSIISRPCLDVCTPVLKALEGFKSSVQTLKIQNELSGTSTHFTKIAACFSTTLKEIIFDEVFILGPSCLNDFLNTLKIITTRLKKLEVLSINPMNYRAIHDCPILINCVPFGDRFAQHFQIGNMTELRVLKFPKQIGSFCLTIPSAELKKLTKLEILDLSGWRLDSFEFLRFMPNLRVFKYAASPGCDIGTLLGFKSDKLEILSFSSNVVLRMEHLKNMKLPHLREINIHHCVQFNGLGDIDDALHEMFPKLSKIIR